MTRMPLGGLCTAILLVGAALAVAETPPEGAPARLLAVAALEQPGGTLLEVQASGPFHYASYEPRQGNVVVDLRGVVSERGALEPAAAVPWISGYRLLPFRNASGDAVVRLDITLKHDCAVEVTQPQPQTLLLACASSSSVPAAVEPAPVETAPAVPARAAPVMTPTQGGTRSEDPVLVRTVAVLPQSDPLTVDIQATGPLAFETRILSNPTRLVVDLPQSFLGTRPRNLTVGRDGVVGVRMAQFQANPPVTRIVVDLSEMVEYHLVPTPDGLRLTLGARSTAQPVPTKSGPEPPAAVTASVPTPAAPPVAREQAPEPVLVASLAPTVPTNLRASASPPAMEPAAVEPAAPAPAVPEPPPAPAPAIADDPEEQVMPAAPAAPQATRRYTGEPISVNLKDVDLKDFFRLIHEISGLNIIVDPNVRGNVTMVLIDVPWDQALDIVLKNNNLGATLEGNVLRIATLDTLKKEQETQRDLAKARAEAVDPVTVPRQLSYARAQDLEAVLRRFLSSRGEIIRDDRTNTIIIRDIPSVIPEMDNLIRQLDRKSLQVEIEARVVSASRAFSRELGTSLATAFTTTGGRSVFGGSLGPSPVTVAGEVLAPTLATNFPVAATSGFLFGHRSPNFALDVILQAAESRDIAKVLSKPRIITQNNVRAEVKQGTRIPVQTVVNNTISTQFIDVVLKLEVKPQITAEGTVFLDIDIENTAIDEGIARINGIPALATQATTTQVLIADGGTVVVGGVMITTNATNVSQVPLLGSIPVLGHLFKSTVVSTDTRELLFFITPRILPG